MTSQITLDGKYLKEALRVLKRTTQLLERNGIPYWLEGGTLLGIVRENRLLPWDNDLDLSIRTEDLDRLLQILPKFFWRGLIVRIRYHKRDDHPLKKGDVRIIKVYASKYFFFKGLVILDIFVQKRLGDQLYWVIGVHRHTKKAVPARFTDELTSVRFNKKNYSIPKLTDEYLTYCFGDWRTPIMTWDCTKDDHSIVR
ncbi:MAG: LicD family protein [Candidatus Neomarinimicrobiota bacterium]